MTDNFRPINDDCSSAGPMTPAQMQPVLRAHGDNAAPNAQAEVI